LLGSAESQDVRVFIWDWDYGGRRVFAVVGAFGVRILWQGHGEFDVSGSTVIVGQSYGSPKSKRPPHLGNMLA